MDLAQRKLSKEEWDSLEVPVSKKELRILKLIQEGYENVNVVYNDTVSLLNFIKIVFSVLPIYALGLIWLGILIGWDKPIFELGAKPFLLAELFKIILLVIISMKVDFFKKFI